jgi:Ca2+-binding RTX toxin-like protein
MTRTVRDGRLRARGLMVSGVAALVFGSFGASLVFGEASHAGWPAIGNHEGHPNQESGTLRGEDGVHNELLGSNGNDSIWAGNEGDVIWGDKEPSGQPESQVDHLHGGAGNDWLYASHGTNYIWTGAGNDHVALVYGHGVVYCNGHGHKTLVMRYLPANRHYSLIGCNNITVEPYRA